MRVLVISNRGMRNRERAFSPATVFTSLSAGLFPGNPCLMSNSYTREGPEGLFEVVFIYKELEVL
jgi:hypothetical protein